MIQNAIKKVIEGKSLTLKEAGDIIDFIADNKALPSQIGAFLTSLKMKGETVDEITGFALKMREKALKINMDEIDTVVDSCGTGGDCSNSFNISTASAILASASGLMVAKHSNFGFTSLCGSSNVVEALKISFTKSPQEITKLLKKNNIVFIHAPYFHKCTQNVNSVRKELGIRTVFNYLGPLTNPVSPTGQVLGVANTEIAQTMAEVLNNLGCKKAMVVCGQDPVIDEISICGKTLVYKLEKGKIEHFEIFPEDFGFTRANIKDIEGGTPETNAKIIKDIFNGVIDGAKLDAVLINTAALLWVGDKTDSIENGIKLAKNLISEGLAKKKLKQIS